MFGRDDSWEGSSGYKKTSCLSASSVGGFGESSREFGRYSRDDHELRDGVTGGMKIGQEERNSWSCYRERNEVGGMLGIVLG
jgi:hypothetical protein